MKTIYYWSPCLTKIGTYRSTINSALSLVKYSKKFYNVKIINACGEWDSKKDFFYENKIGLIDLGVSYYNILPKSGYLKSRFSYLIIFILSFIPLTKLLLKDKPDYFIIHLLTALPILLKTIIGFKSKLILRISGFPKLNFIRKFFWIILNSKFFKITSPTKHLLHQLVNDNIFKAGHIFFLPDPIIKVSEFKFIKKEEDNFFKKKYFIAAGRLTKQKNFSYLIEEFSKFLKNNDKYDLYIFGEGEDKNKLELLIKQKNIENKVFLKGYTNKINFYMKNAEAFILSSLWEDPGFVLIEAAMNNLFIISSNCKNGPSEFLKNGECGILYESNKKNSLLYSLKKFSEIQSSNKIFLKKKNAKLNCKNYTLLNHHNILLSKILST